MIANVQKITVNIGTKCFSTIFILPVTSVLNLDTDRCLVSIGYLTQVGNSDSHWSTTIDLVFNVVLRSNVPYFNLRYMSRALPKVSICHGRYFLSIRP